MKNLSYSIASLFLLIALLVPATVLAQGPTTASAFTIQNPSGDKVTLRIPTSSATYSLLFPSTPPVDGALFTASGTGGNTSWLLPGGVGQVLQIVGGLPVWANVNLLPNGSTTNSTLIWNGTNWVENVNVTMTPGGDVTTGGDLTVTGPNVNLPAGSISNTELANSSIGVAYGTGVSGDATVALGGTLNLANTGVTSIVGGAGISVSGATGAVTITSLGIGTIVGTPNQVLANTVLGVTTLSAPQNIHTGATPTFAGMTLTTLTNDNTVPSVVVSDGGVLKTRAISSFPSNGAEPFITFGTGTAALTNNRVATAGTGISINPGTVDNDPFTITNTGVTSVTGGSGISVSGSTGAVTITNNGITSIVGTPNQVIANTVSGVTTLSTPQNIHTGASPTFVGATLTGLANDNTVPSVVVSDGGVLKTRAVSSLLSGSGGRVSTATATSGGGGWSMTITDAAVTATSPIIVSYEDPADGAQKSVHVGSRTGTTFTVHFAGKPVAGSFVNYSVL